MSKLKRRKLSVEESRTEQQTRIKKSKQDNIKSVQDSSCATTSTGSRERWWESSDLTDVERLWALTLRALCPNLQSDDLEESIPELPPPSSTKTPVQGLNDWRWNNADKDANTPPDLPAPSFLVLPPPANDFKNASQPAAEVKSDPPCLTDQESVSVCAIQTAQKHHLDDEENCNEDLELLDEQSDRFGQATNVPETRRNEAESRTAGSGAGEVAGQPETGIGTISGAERLGSVLGTKHEASRSGSKQRAKSGSGLGPGTKSGIGKEGKSGLGGSGSRLLRNSIQSGYGTVLETKSAASGSGLGVGTKFGASGSRQSLGTNSGSSGSGLGLETKSGAGWSGLRTKSVASVSALGLETKSRESGSGQGLGAKSGTSGSGLGQETKAGMTQEVKTGLIGSSSGLGTNSEAGLETTRSPEESGSGLETKSGAESSSGLECCPMCLMPFPAGFTQMECDGHLAQCLSEMQDDIIW